VYHVIVLGFIPRSLHPVAFLLVGVAISILVAAASWAVFEKPVLRLKRFFPRAG
jgi:peptidoglycan/LPS O-acetylase OafA/YrhL